MNNQFEPLEEGEVISADHNAHLPIGHHTFRVGELTAAIKKQLEIATGTSGEGKDDLLSAFGIHCEALRFGSNAWQKGRLRLCLEFCPDDSFSSSSQTASRSRGTQNHSASSPNVYSGVSPTVTTIAGEDGNSLKLVTGEPTIAHGKAAILTGLVATGATMAAVGAEPELSNSAEVAPVADAPTFLETTPIAPMAEAILLPEDRTTGTSHDRDLEEITFEFNRGDVNQGVLSTNGSMDLDLTDTAVDNDYLEFEMTGLPETPDFNELVSQPENSGMLIDEVWSEMNQPNWPGIYS